MSEYPEGPIPIADQAEGREAWLTAREPGVTATQAAKLVSGGIATRRAILKEKEEGSSFHGNKYTERGVRREKFIADWVLRKFGIPANSWLFARYGNPLHMATPDGIAFTYGFDSCTAGCEIKSTMEDWAKGTPMGSIATIPRLYLDQCYWGMHVTRAEKWLFVWEQCDKDGQPLEMEPKWFWIYRDEARIDKLIAGADRFLEWRAAGAPGLDNDVDEELDEALSAFAAARALKLAAAADEKAAETIIRAHIAATEGADKEGLVVSGSDAAFNFSVEGTSFDSAAWAKRAPKQAAIYAAAQQKYRKPATPKLTVTPHKRKAAA